MQAVWHADETMAIELHFSEFWTLLTVLGKKHKVDSKNPTKKISKVKSFYGFLLKLQEKFQRLEMINVQKK